jgi:hypothetical protein
MIFVQLVTILRSALFRVSNDVSRQHIGPIFKGKEVQEGKKNHGYEDIVRLYRT